MTVQEDKLSAIYIPQPRLDSATSNDTVLLTERILHRLGSQILQAFMQALMQSI